MLIFFTIVHVLLCIFMIFVILLQPGKDAGMGAALGGGAATSAFGGRGAATFLTKLTGFCATAFFLTSLGLSFADHKASVGDSIVVDQPAVVPPTTTPTAPAATPPAPTEMAPSSPTEANPKPVEAPPAPSANDAVPAQK